MGFREKEDLQTVADAVMARLGPNVKIGTHGESMGGATVVQHAAKRGYSRLFLMPDAKHAESICAHGDIYEKLISGFLQKVDAEGE